MYGPLSPKDLLTHRWNAPPTALSLTRPAADVIFPLPQLRSRLDADAATYTLGLGYAPGISLPEALGYYRMHGANGFAQAPDRFEKQLSVEHELIRVCRERGWDPRIHAKVYRDTRRMPHLDEAGILQRPLSVRLIDCWSTKASLPGRIRHVLTELVASLK
jgi:hypothetical protein